MAVGIIVMKCVRCNTECKRTNNKQRYCQNCREAIRKTKYAEYLRTHRTRGRLLSKICDSCSMEYSHNSPSQLRCDSCRDSHKRQLNSKKSEYWKQWRKLNPNYQTEYHKNPRKRLESAIRTSIRCELKKRKGGKCLIHTGLPPKALMQYLLEHESNSDGLFTEQNYGQVWHIDHIRPLASFSDTELTTAWHHTNLQPLTRLANLLKGSKWNGKYCFRRDLTLQQNNLKN